MRNTKTLERKKKIIDAKQAAAQVKDGMTIGIGTRAYPMMVIWEIIRNRVENLTIVGGAASRLPIDILIGAGCVKKLLTSCVIGDYLAGIGPCFRTMAERGELEYWEASEGVMYAALRASSMALPFLPYRGVVGTSYPEVNPDLKVFQDPIKGETLVAVPAITPELTFLHAGYGDAYGNIQHTGPAGSDMALVDASKRVIVQVEKIISNEEIRMHREKTTISGVDVEAVIRAPFGSYPFISPGFYLNDDEHIREYLSAAGALRAGDKAPLQAYFDKYFYGPETFLDYLELMGVKRLLSLYEY